jgi:hypothetical protein
LFNCSGPFRQMRTVDSFLLTEHVYFTSHSMIRIQVQSLPLPVVRWLIVVKKWFLRTICGSRNIIAGQSDFVTPRLGVQSSLAVWTRLLWSPPTTPRAPAAHFF